MSPARGELKRIHNWLKHILTVELCQLPVPSFTTEPKETDPMSQLGQKVSLSLSLVLCIWRGPSMPWCSLAGIEQQIINFDRCLIGLPLYHTKTPRATQQESMQCFLVFWRVCVLVLCQCVNLCATILVPVGCHGISLRRVLRSSIERAC